MVGLDVFSPDPPKSVLSKIDRKLKGEIGHLIWTKMPRTIATSLALLFFALFFF